MPAPNGDGAATHESVQGGYHRRCQGSTKIALGYTATRTIGPLETRSLAIAGVCFMDSSAYQ